MSLSEREIAFSRVAVERGFAPRVPLQSGIGEFLDRRRAGSRLGFDQHLVEIGMIDEATRQRILHIVSGYERDLRLARLALRNGMVTHEQVNECLEAQARWRAQKRDITIGELLVEKRYLTPARRRALLSHMEKNPPRPSRRLSGSEARKRAYGRRDSERLAAGERTVRDGDDSSDRIAAPRRSSGQHPVAGQRPTSGRYPAPGPTASGRFVPPQPTPPRPSTPPTDPEVIAPGLPTDPDVDLELPSDADGLIEMPEDLLASQLDENHEAAKLLAGAVDLTAYAESVLDTSTAALPIPDWTQGPLPPGSVPVTSDSSPAAFAPTMQEGVPTSSVAPYGRPTPTRPPPLSEMPTQGEHPRPPPLPDDLVKTAWLEPGGPGAPTLEQFHEVVRAAFLEAFARAWEHAWANAWQRIYGTPPPPPPPPPPMMGPPSSGPSSG